MGRPKNQTPQKITSISIPLDTYNELKNKGVSVVTIFRKGYGVWKKEEQGKEDIDEKIKKIQEEIQIIKNTFSRKIAEIETKIETKTDFKKE